MPSNRKRSCRAGPRPSEPLLYKARPSKYSLDSLTITHPFHPLFGQCLTVLITMRKCTGLWFMCEVDGRRRVTVRQEWTDRGVPASSDRLAVDGLGAARALVDAIDATRTGSPHEVPPEQGQDRDGSDEPGTRAVERARPAPSGDGGGEHARGAAERGCGR
ncbi:DUF5372 family protein [Jidongwangia harbinensis]|uniref:DUF5372 family protein n=1 Tax=Jidongwangia harbinensis TaxID=2878561 RepID=UPI001CDA3A46|nr:Y4bD/Y4pK family protein [Jidongwangia harbinensis]MCA2217092.1 Y4bD/Y4pK family protein [Jidongwangia harbinensis]